MTMEVDGITLVLLRMPDSECKWLKVPMGSIVVMAKGPSGREHSTAIISPDMDEMAVWEAIGEGLFIGRPAVIAALLEYVKTPVEKAVFTVLKYGEKPTTEIDVGHIRINGSWNQVVFPRRVSEEVVRAFFAKYLTPDLGMGIENIYSDGSMEDFEVKVAVTPPLTEAKESQLKFYLTSLSGPF